MKERRALIEGLTVVDSSQKEREKAFVYGDAPKSESTETNTATTDPAPSPTGDTRSAPTSEPEPKILPQFTGRVPVTTRARPEVASALKRASLTRQLEGAEPFYVQDIMEAALESWLRQHGYIT